MWALWLHSHVIMDTLYLDQAEQPVKIQDTGITHQQHATEVMKKINVIILFHYFPSYSFLALNFIISFF